MPAPEVKVDPIGDDDRVAWESLWRGYLEFYKTSQTVEATDATWLRLHDPAEPMHGLAAFEGERMLGIVHYLFHRSFWTIGNYCYLQDLFVLDEARGRGIGRALIEAVYRAARDAGASRVYWLTEEGNTAARALYDKVADRSGFIQYRKIF